MCTTNICGLNPFPHTANLQQTTLKMSIQKYGKTETIIVGIITEQNWKHCGKRRNCMFSKVACCRCVFIFWWEKVNLIHNGFNLINLTFSHQKIKTHLHLSSALKLPDSFPIYTNSFYQTLIKLVEKFCLWS